MSSHSEIDFDFVQLLGTSKTKGERNISRKRKTVQGNAEERELRNGTLKSTEQELRQYDTLSDQEKKMVDQVMAAKQYQSREEGRSVDDWKAKENKETFTTINELFQMKNNEEDRRAEIIELEKKVDMCRDDGNCSQIRGVIYALEILQESGKDMLDVRSIANHIFNPYMKRATPSISQLQIAIEVIILVFRKEVISLAEPKKKKKRRKKGSELRKKIDDALVDVFLV